jgi:hypothetical protein
MSDTSTEGLTVGCTFPLLIVPPKSPLLTTNLAAEWGFARINIHLCRLTALAKSPVLADACNKLIRSYDMFATYAKGKYIANREHSLSEAELLVAKATMQQLGQSLIKDKEAFCQSVGILVRAKIQTMEKALEASEMAVKEAEVSTQQESQEGDHT